MSEETSWRSTGSVYLWRRIRRSVFENGKVVGFSDGSVVGFLSEHESDYVSSTTGQPSALWHGMVSYKLQIVDVVCLFLNFLFILKLFNLQLYFTFFVHHIYIHVNSCV